MRNQREQIGLKGAKKRLVLGLQLRTRLMADCKALKSGIPSREGARFFRALDHDLIRSRTL